MTHEKSRDYCQRQNAQLVTFESKEKYNLVTDWVWNYWNKANKGWVLKGYWTDMQLQVSAHKWLFHKFLSSLPPQIESDIFTQERGPG